MKKISLLVSITLLFSLLLLGCGLSTEETIQNAQEYVAANDYAAAESELLSVLEKEPENVLIKEELGTMYRQQAMSMQTADEMLACFEKAQNNIEGFVYTKDELEALAKVSIESQSKETEVFGIIQQIEASDASLAIDEMLYDILGKVAVEKCETDSQKRELLDKWLEKDSTNTTAVCLKAVIALGIDKKIYDESNQYDNMTNMCNEYGGKYAVGLYIIGDEGGYHQTYNQCVFDENNQLIYAQNAFIPGYMYDDYYGGDYHTNIVFEYEESNLVSLTNNEEMDFDLFYDENNNLIRVEKMGIVTSEFQYDEQNRLIYETNTTGGGSWNKYQYNDENGKVTVESYGYNIWEDEYFHNINELDTYYSWRFGVHKLSEASIILDEKVTMTNEIEILKLSDGNEIWFPIGAGETITVKREQYVNANVNAIVPERAGFIYTIQYETGEEVEITYDEYGLAKTFVTRNDNYANIYYMHTIISEDGRMIYRVPIHVMMDIKVRGVDYNIEYMYDGHKMYMSDFNTYKYLYPMRESSSLEVYYLAD